MYLLVPFIQQNLKKIFKVVPELWECAIFRHKMADLSWTKFFWCKQLLLLFIYLLALFIVQNFKRLLQQIQSYEDASSLGPKSSFAPNNFFLKITTDIIFSYLLAPFIRQNFLKILRANPELWGCAIFGPKIADFSWTNFFWYKPLLLLSFTYWPFSLCKI